jgi:hypothetical protein
MSGTASCAGTSGPASADAPNEIAEKIKQEKEERICAKRDCFKALFAEWLTNRAECLRPDTDWPARDEMSHDEREIELARTITTTPFPWRRASCLAPLFLEER